MHRLPKRSRGSRADTRAGARDSRRFRLRSAAVIAALVLALVLPAADRSPADDRQLLARRLETLRRILPDGPTAPSDVALVREMADAAKLTGVDALARPPAEAGTIGYVTLDFTATGRFFDIERFFRQVALSYRLIDVESLTLTAGQADLVRLTAVLRLPFRPARAPVPPAPEDVRQKVAGLSRAVADKFLHDQGLAVGKTEAIVTWRRARRNPRAFLLELAAALRDRPVVLRQASLAEEFRFRGVAVGTATVQALERRLERGLFRVSDFVVARQGACHHFEVRGQSPVVGPEAELPLPAEDPFAQDEAPCQVNRDPQRDLGLKSPKPRPGSVGQLTLRLRGVDAADVFQILTEMTGQGFLVDGDVVGRVSGDLMRVTLEEALNVLEDVGLRVSAPGPLRRVSLGSSVPRPAAKPTKEKKGAKGAKPPEEGAQGESGRAAAEGAPSGAARLSLALKRAEVRDVLATMAEVDPSYAAFGPQGSFGRASVWARDLALTDVWLAVTKSVQLVERFEEGRRLLERNPGSQEVLVPVASTADPEAPRLELGAQELAVVETDLVGVASARTGWRAYVYTPTGALVSYAVGDRLADGVVKGVESTDVLIETDEGPLHVFLPAR
jgi:hypothetical protein